MPMTCDATMTRFFEQTAAELVGAEHCVRIGHRTGSTDMGDLSMVMPVLHPYIGGATGTGHGADYQIVDPALAFVTQAKALAAYFQGMTSVETGGIHPSSRTYIDGILRLETIFSR